MTTIRQFINRNHISMTSLWADSNPNMDDMPDGSSHWKCKLRHQNRQITTYYSMGPAYSHNPKVDDVLDCLSRDSNSIANETTFEEWCGDLGYDLDSRRAERGFKACEKQAQKLEHFLGAGLFQELLFDVEGL